MVGIAAVVSGQIITAAWGNSVKTYMETPDFDPTITKSDPKLVLKDSDGTTPTNYVGTVEGQEADGTFVWRIGHNSAASDDLNIYNAGDGITFYSNGHLEVTIDDTQTLFAGAIAVGANKIGYDATHGMVFDASGNVTLDGTIGLGGNLVLGANYISNDGDNEGISIDASGNVTLSGTLQTAGNITINKTTGIPILTVVSGDDNAYIYMDAFTNKDPKMYWRENGTNRFNFSYDTSAGLMTFYDYVNSEYMLKYNTGTKLLNFLHDRFGIDANGDISEIGNNTTFQILGSGAAPTIQFDTNDKLEYASDVYNFYIASAVELSLSANEVDFKDNYQKGMDMQVGITAHAGGGQADATALTSNYCEISTCATGGDSVKLPAAAVGLWCVITNHGVNSCDVFPNTDDAINEGAANAAKALAANASLHCYCYDSTNWECLTLAR